MSKIKHFYTYIKYIIFLLQITMAEWERGRKEADKTTDVSESFMLPPAERNLFPLRSLRTLFPACISLILESSALLLPPQGSPPGLPV